MTVMKTCKGCENDFEQTLYHNRDLSEYCTECLREIAKQREDELQFIRDQRDSQREWNTDMVGELYERQRITEVRK